MKKKKENSQSQNNKIKILVENFNYETEKYELGKQDIFFASIREIERILTQIPSIKEIKASIPVRIVSKDFIFLKFNDNTYYYEPNLSFSLFIIDSQFTNIKYQFKLEELQDIITKSKKSKFDKFGKVSSIIIDNLWLVLPITNTIALIRIILSEISKQVANLIIVSFMFWLISFCIYSVIYGIRIFNKFRNNPQKIIVQYDIPLLDSFSTLNVSEFIIIAGQIALIIFADFYEAKFTIFDIIKYFCFFLSIFSKTWGFSKAYKRNRALKEFNIQLLLYKMQTELKSSEKQYLLYITSLIKRKPLTSVEKIPKFISLFSILLTFIPIITYFFIVS